MGDQVETEKRKWKDITEKEESTSKEIWKKKSEFFSSEKHLISLESQSKNNTRNFQNFQNYTGRPIWRNRPNLTSRVNNRNFINRNADFNRSPYIAPNYYNQRFRPNRFNNIPRSNYQGFRVDRNVWRQNRPRNINMNSNENDLLNPDDDLIDIEERKDLHNSNSFLD